MSAPENSPLPPGSDGTTIIDKELRKELSKSYIDYAMSVIIGRAIPDVRDGLKPVQRRILYSMWENNFIHSQPHRKCARIVGDCLGRYHPHGDQSVYASLVRMAQDFSMRYQLIDGQGNFGSVDGDEAAAMRYTEARLARITDEMMLDIDKDTVNFQDNFDGSIKEPIFLPSKIPQLLFNGTSGIAVGMSTSIAPHNLSEICAAIIAMIEKDPTPLTPQEIQQYIKGPDFPTGGIILGEKGILEILQTGRGAVMLRGKAEIQPAVVGKKRDAIIITEIPYMVNKARMIETIAEYVNKNQLPEISDIRDESDRSGMRVVIELKHGADANVCLNKLYYKTQLQTSFNIINLVLINNGRQPKILNYIELLQEFITHREAVIRRRTQFELAKAQSRLHILKGLLIAIQNIDKVIRLIRNSATVEDASKGLQSQFTLSEIQANEILKMPLSRLTNLQTQKLHEEETELLQKITEFQAILADRQKILQIIKQETHDIVEKYSDPRRTEIHPAEDTDKFDVINTIPVEKCVIVITANQSIKRMTEQQYQAQGRGGKGKRGMTMREEDIVQEVFTVSSHDTILLFTQQGRIYSLPAFNIPLSNRNARGKALVNYVQLQPDERIIDITNVASFDDISSLVMVSTLGIIKKTPLSEFAKIRKTGIHCMNIRESDQLICAKLCHQDQEVLLATQKGYLARFPEHELRPLGRTAQGVRGITLRSPEDRVIDMVIADPTTKIFTVTRRGYGKLSDLSLYRLTHRGSKGVINMKLRDPLDKIIAIKSIPYEMNVLLASKNGIIIRVRTEDIRQTGRAAKGVIIMRLDEQDEVSSVALCELQKLEEDVEIPTVTPEIDLNGEEETLEESEEENGESNGEPVDIDEGKENHDQENLTSPPPSLHDDDDEAHENDDQDDDDNTSTQSDDDE